MERSINIILVIFATLVTVSPLLDTKITATVKVQHVMVDQRVQLSCKLNNFKVLGQSVIFYKVGLGAGESKPSLKVISKAIIIEKEFEQRYSVEAEGIEGDFQYEFVLTISSIQDSDDGKFMCGVTDSSRETVVSDTLELIVIKNVTDISLQLGDKSTKADENLSVLIRGKFNRIPLTCTVSGGNPAPDVTVTVGGKDITAELVKVSPPIQSVTVVGDAFNGSRMWKYTVRSSKWVFSDSETATVPEIKFGREKPYVANDYIIKEDYLNKKIACSATTPGSSKTITASATISLNEKPTFKCKKKSVEIGASTVISCLISHNIQAVGQVAWVDQQTQYVIRPNESKKGFKARLEKVDNKTVRAILEIRELPLKSNLYQIEVKHMTWVVSHKIRVDSLSTVQRKTEPKPTGPVSKEDNKAGSLVTWTPLIVLAAVISVVRVF